MLHFSRWAMASIVAVVVASIIVVLPNFFSEETVAGWPDWMPKNRIVLGLDLQGGSYLLYEVDRTDWVVDQLTALQSEIRTTLRQDPLVPSTGLTSSDQIAANCTTGVEANCFVQVRITDPTQIAEARLRLEQLRNPLTTTILGAASNFEFDLSINADGVARFTFSEAGLTQRLQQIVQQSIAVIDRRINQLGTLEPSIQREGASRILVEAPGLDDPQRLKDLIGQTAQMTLHLVNGGPVAIDTVPPAGQIIVPLTENPAAGYLLEETPRLRGEQIIDAQTTFDQTDGLPVVSFRLNTSGARIFGELTQNNVNRQFAIVLDNEVISAPVIQQPILGGSAVIRGNFTVTEANDLAILLRAGALPARLTIFEERTVGPSLGEDSIRAGILACIVALIGIAVFMVVCYGLMGLFSVFALMAQNAIMLGILTLLGATLTLPGIAGFVLTMGIAVDANVLIYERMREEARLGKSVIASLDQGFKRAIATIVDSHLTALVAAIALFWLGSGPIRGFAVTFGIGIVSTLFTVYLITRLIVAVWYRSARPKTVPL